jgi:type I restriction enzyme R subunit
VRESMTEENTKPLDKEDAISQIPALQLLQDLGYDYLTTDEAVKLRGGRLSNVLLEGVLVDWLRSHNRIRYRGQEHPFSEGNVQSAVQALKSVVYDGLVRTNEKIYDLLCLGKSLQQSIDGDVKSFPFHYIDWDEPENNVFHVTDEFSVERTGSHETRRPDIVLFVNGIPFAVIECKRPSIKDPITEAISQHIRNQRDAEIPKLFLYSQLLMALSKNEAQFGTTATPAKFWAVWKEREDINAQLLEFINKPLSEKKKDRMFSTRPGHVRKHFDALETDGPRDITEQDRSIFALCRKDRLLELTYRYVLFDAGEKKIARYQQYFTVRNILSRIKSQDQDGRRKGGVVWHTQGSGKSLTMVMLAKAIALDEGIENHKVILVTDRVDLDDQIYDTFRHCGQEPVKARTGKHLIELVEGNKERIVTTIIDKFEAALGKKEVRNEDRNIFVLVDEGHRTQYGPLHAKMRKVLPNACYIAFTGTPVMTKDKNTIQKFGGLIEPAYTIKKAVEDKAVVRLLYEGRHVEQDVDSAAVDSWFERITERLTPEQKADLKRKFSTADQLNKAEQKIMRIAWDISVHFRDNWQETPFKGQLVAPDKHSAIRYKANIDECGMVSSQVLISGPDDREGNTDIYEENKEAVIRFWEQMMKQYGTEKEYNKQLINSFKHGDEPEIIVVVDKLITGFDAPRNTVLYLTRKLQGHTLLQAIARVNRLHDGKDFGYVIDYYGVLSGLHEALDLYGGLPDFDKADLEGTLTDVSGYVDTLAQKHSDAWDIFKGVKNKRDEEAYERLLADDALRDQFYDRLSAFSRCLAVALSTVKFIEDTSEDRTEKYKSDLKFFMNLRTAVQRRYGETVDFKEYEKKIQKLIDTHVGTGEVEQLTELVDIFDEERFAQEVEKVHGAASQADTIAHRTSKTLEEKWKNEDPAFYRQFSRMLKDVIDGWRAQRLSDVEYLKKVKDLMAKVRDRTGDDTPEPLKEYEVARSFYGVVRETFAEYGVKDEKQDAEAEVSLKIDEIIRKKKIVNWETNPDVQNQMRTEIEDALFELKEEHGIDFSFDDIDKIMDECIDIAKARYPTK